MNDERGMMMVTTLDIRLQFPLTWLTYPNGTRVREIQDCSIDRTKDIKLWLSKTWVLHLRMDCHGIHKRQILFGSGQIWHNFVALGLGQLKESDIVVYLHQERKDNIAMSKAASVLFCLMPAKSSYQQILASLARHDFKADIWYRGITTIGLMINGETQCQHTSNPALITLSNPHPLEASSWRCEWRRLVRDA